MGTVLAKLYMSYKSKYGRRCNFVLFCDLFESSSGLVGGQWLH